MLTECRWESTCFVGRGQTWLSWVSPRFTRCREQPRADMTGDDLASCATTPVLEMWMCVAFYWPCSSIDGPLLVDYIDRFNTELAFTFPPDKQAQCQTNLPRVFRQLSCVMFFFLLLEVLGVSNLARSPDVTVSRAYKRHCRYRCFKPSIKTVRHLNHDQRLFAMFLCHKIRVFYDCASTQFQQTSLKCVISCSLWTSEILTHAR